MPKPATIITEKYTDISTWFFYVFFLFKFAFFVFSFIVDLLAFRLVLKFDFFCDRRSLDSNCLLSEYYDCFCQRLPWDIFAAPNEYDFKWLLYL